jgi:S-adenosylmethionine-dependent methyltransferase
MDQDESQTIAQYMTAAQIDQVRQAMQEIHFAKLSPEFMAGPEGQAALHQYTTRRFYECLRVIVPWVRKHCDLSAATVVEIGCGTGSSTAAFAYLCRKVVGFDIEKEAVEAARQRFEILGLKNASAEAVPPAELLGTVRARFAPGTVDAVFLYAVIEHCTLQERTETLKTAWDVLRPGGVLIVADTPNRLTYTDHHTAWMPFFHMLPADVAMAYADRSPRASFPDSINRALAVSRATAEEVLTRWGRGVSYHDFELAIGDLTNLVVGDGFEDEILFMKPVSIEEKLLYAYWKAMKLTIPPGFVRQSIDVILEKPGGPKPSQPANRDLTELTRL